MFHVKHLAPLLAAALACQDAGDVLYEPERIVPVEIAPGLLRLTAGDQPDYARAVLDDGTILFATRGLRGASDSFALVTTDPAGGPARLITSPYLYGFPAQRVWTWVPGAARSILFSLMHTAPRFHWCGIEGSETAPGPPRPPLAGWHMNVLPAIDGPAVWDLFRPARELPAFENAIVSPTGRPQGPKRIQALPAMVEADSIGANPFGPAATGDLGFAYASDGAVVWRYDLTDTAAAPDSVTWGAYPLLSGDGATLFVSRTSVTDSVVTFQRFVYFDWICDQTYVTYSWGDWHVVRHDLATGTEDTIGLGADMARFGDTALVVRRPDGLHVLSLATGGSIVLVEDSTAASPVTARSRNGVAFTSRRFGSPDILFLRLD